MSPTITKSNSFARKRCAVEVVRGAFLEIEDAHEADDEHHARRETESGIDSEQLARGVDVQLALDQDEFDRERGDECECREVVQESEEGDHRAIVRSRVRSAQSGHGCAIDACLRTGGDPAVVSVHSTRKPLRVSTTRGYIASACGAEMPLALSQRPPASAECIA